MSAELVHPEMEAEDRAILEAELEGIEAEVAKKSFRRFAEQAWNIIEPDVALNWNWHHDAMSEDLEKLARGETDRLL